MPQRPSWSLLAVLCLLSAIVGLGWATVSERPEALYGRARSALRASLGLPKHWVALPGPGQADGRQPINCPAPENTLTLVTGGQSNAANAVSLPSQTPAETAAVVWFDGRCWPAADPVLGATEGEPGSLWPPLAAGLAEATGRTVLLINGAVGGTQVADWLDDRSGYYAALADRVASAQTAGYEPSLILWHQGETDAAAEHDMARLEAAFDSLADRLLADMPQAQLYLFQASRCIGVGRSEGVEGVRQAQAATVLAHPRAVLGMNTDTLGKEFRWDTCHFNSRGREVIVATVLPELEVLLSED